MKKMTEKGVAYSPAKLPNLSAAVYPSVNYNHTSERTNATTLELSITVIISVNEVSNERQHKIMNGTSKFLFESDEKLSVDYLYPAWVIAFNNVNTAVQKLFEFEKLPIMKVSVSSKEQLRSTIEPIVSMFNDTPYRPD